MAVGRFVVAAAGVLVAIAQLVQASPALASDSTAAPVIGQRDQSWASLPLGTSMTETIGSSGCVISSVAMLLGSYGVKLDPAQVNSWLTANAGYVGDDNFLWGEVAPLSGGRVSFDGWYGADLEIVNSELIFGKPVIAEVSLNGNQHFLLLTGFSANGYWMNDPWFGDHANFSDRYGDPSTGIISIRTFSPVGALDRTPSRRALS
ncbi:MAG: C39 family peptidase [Candidatus Dormibacteraeota bacterium]|nr:C39 family peptidase [Candidatus Dormibacteraeota bacterium]